jgi:hypothetical protein
MKAFTKTTILITIIILSSCKKEEIESKFKGDYNIINNSAYDIKINSFNASGQNNSMIPVDSFKIKSGDSLFITKEGKTNKKLSNSDYNPFTQGDSVVLSFSNSKCIKYNNLEKNDFLNINNYSANKIKDNHFSFRYSISEELLIKAQNCY